MTVESNHLNTHLVYTFQRIHFEKNYFIVYTKKMDIYSFIIGFFFGR